MMEMRVVNTSEYNACEFCRCLGEGGLGGLISYWFLMGCLIAIYASRKGREFLTLLVVWCGVIRHGEGEGGSWCCVCCVCKGVLYACVAICSSAVWRAVFSSCCVC